jgi:guanylate kinase
LEERLIKRGTDDFSVIKDRMKITAEEILTIKKCDFIKDVFINDELDKTYKSFRERMLELYPQLISL